MLRIHCRPARCALDHMDGSGICGSTQRVKAVLIRRDVCNQRESQEDQGPRNHTSQMEGLAPVSDRPVTTRSRLRRVRWIRQGPYHPRSDRDVVSPRKELEDERMSSAVARLPLVECDT